MTTVDTAFVLAAGLGTRMRPLTDTVPKPLVNLRGKALIDHVLDRLAPAGIQRVVVNVHYRADMIEAHLARRRRPRIEFSDERSALLDTGGGLVKAWPLMGPGPVIVHNSDSVWIEERESALAEVIARGADPSLDCVFLLAERTGSLGYDGKGDFDLTADGVPVRRRPGGDARYVFAGASIAKAPLLEGAPEGAFSLNRLWDKAIAAGRAGAVVLRGTWMHVGDPAALAAAEQLMDARHGRC